MYTTEEIGEVLLSHVGKTAKLKSFSNRIPAKAYNGIAQKRNNSSERIVITAHIDAKKGTPGAIDNASGIVGLLLVAELLKDYDGTKAIEIIAFNGEDYFAVPGQMDYIRKNQNKFKDIILNINIDGARYKEGETSLSFFDVPEAIQKNAHAVFRKYRGITEGIQWPQGDHSIFIQQGCPAIAVSSRWFIENIETQEITHTPKNNIDIVDTEKIVKIAEALDWFIRRM